MKLKVFLKPTTVWYAGGLLIGQFWLPHMVAAITEKKLGQFCIGVLGFLIFTFIVGVIELIVNAISENP